VQVRIAALWTNLGSEDASQEDIHRNHFHSEGVVGGVASYAIASACQMFGGEVSSSLLFWNPW